jgi:hypothetical protein
MSHQLQLGYLNLYMLAFGFSLIYAKFEILAEALKRSEVHLLKFSTQFMILHSFTSLP